MALWRSPGLPSMDLERLLLASQVISFVYATIPALGQDLVEIVPESQKANLQSKINQVAQDYENQLKQPELALVQLIRDKISIHLRMLPNTVETWNRPADPEHMLSKFALSLTKDVENLQGALARVLCKKDVESINQHVIKNLHSEISEQLKVLLKVNDIPVKDKLCCDLECILTCIRQLPNGKLPNRGELDELLESLTMNLEDK